MTTKLSYRTCVQELKDRVPEFVQSDAEFDPDLPNDAFGTFAFYLVERIFNRSDEGGDLLRRAFALLDEMANSGDEEVVNLLVVSVLEILADESQILGYLRLQLSDKPRRLFERVLRGWVD